MLSSMEELFAVFSSLLFLGIVSSRQFLYMALQAVPIFRIIAECHNPKCIMIDFSLIPAVDDGFSGNKKLHNQAGKIGNHRIHLAEGFDVVRSFVKEYIGKLFYLSETMTMTINYL